MLRRRPAGAATRGACVATTADLECVSARPPAPPRPLPRPRPAPAAPPHRSHAPRAALLTEHVRRYATEEAIAPPPQHSDDLSSDSESELSEFSEDEARDMEL